MKTLKLIFQSLFSNVPVMDARKQPWYLAVIIFISSILIASYPTFNQINTSKGSAFLSGNTYSIENALTVFSEILEDEDVDLVVTSQEVEETTVYRLTNQSTVWSDAFYSVLDNEPGFPYFAYSVSGSDRLRVFFQGEQTNEATTEFINDLLTLPTGDDDISSFLFLTNERVFMYLYNPAALLAGTASGKNPLAVFTGYYHGVEVGTNLRNFSLTDVDGNALDETNVSEYIQLVFGNWLNFFDESYAFLRSELLWIQTGLMVGVNALMALMMSLVIFIMTRGKNNPNKHFKFGETMKMGAWSLLSPALLTLVAGSLFPEFAGTAFVLFVGLRLMWLSSKYLRPVDNVVVTPTKK
jgi:hypothetical protein